MWLHQAAAGLAAIYGALLLRRVVRKRLERLDPTGQVPAARLLRMGSFEGETVDAFLDRALNSPFPFEGKEWADHQPPKGEPGDTYGGVTPKDPWGQGASLERSTRPALPRAFRGLEPNSYYRVACTHCGDTKDCWTDDEGRPDNDHDMWHKHGDEAYPTVPQ